MLLAVVMFLSAVQFITLCGKMCTDTKMLVKIISDEKLRAHDDRVNGVKAIQEQLSRQYGVSLGHMRDLARLMRIRSPYPVELRGGSVEGDPDFAIIRQIIHWNVQWIMDDNPNLLPSCQIVCPQDLLKPRTEIEWMRLGELFDREAGILIDRPERNAVAELVDYINDADLKTMSVDQLCRTPICIKPNTTYEFKQQKCQYCNCICCDCYNCTKYREMFGIRTSLTRTGKVADWDKINLRVEKSIGSSQKEAENDEQRYRLMEIIHKKLMMDNEKLPNKYSLLNPAGNTYQKIRKMATHIQYGKIQRKMTIEDCEIRREGERIYKLVLSKLLNDPQIFSIKERIRKKIVDEQEFDDIECSSGEGSDVMTTLSHNIEQHESVIYSSSEETVC